MLQPDEQVNFLVGIARLCRVSEHKPGAIALRVGLTDLPRLSLNYRVSDPEGEIKRIPGYKSHRIKTRLTGVDVEIHYEPSVFPFELWKSLGSLRDHPSLELTIRQELLSLFDGDKP
jgi:hypothetical protein